MNHIETVLKYLAAALSFLGVNTLIEFQPLTFFQKLYQAFVCATILLYLFEFVFTFYHNSHNTEDVLTGDQIILSLCIVGITTFIIRCVIMLNKRDKFRFLINWIRDVHKTTLDNKIIERCTDQSFDETKKHLLKVWRYFVLH